MSDQGRELPMLADFMSAFQQSRNARAAAAEAMANAAKAQAEVEKIDERVFDLFQMVHIQMVEQQAKLSRDEHSLNQDRTSFEEYKQRELAQIQEQRDMVVTWGQEQKAAIQALSKQTPNTIVQKRNIY